MSEKISQETLPEDTEAHQAWSTARKTGIAKASQTIIGQAAKQLLQDSTDADIQLQSRQRAQALKDEVAAILSFQGSETWAGSPPTNWTRRTATAVLQLWEGNSYKLGDWNREGRPSIGDENRKWSGWADNERTIPNVEEYIGYLYQDRSPGFEWDNQIQLLKSFEETEKAVKEAQAALAGGLVLP
ncbi:hypothetical protein BLS_009487 [Venturia inaequalis]|uniref:Uncharacterized protein n=1 Tax=Venturia inaequalis TaxID=5025 RepID=A0A8H3YMQ5_VENIN|nr:hypothetical protein BLS_009487 [Venturia inaequalis]KAE9970402.1 hypothetical protein EG327_010287 [Venturia inaequalis]